MLDNIGGLFQNYGEFNEALKYYNRALSIYERVKGKESFDSIVTLTNIGLIYRSQDKLN